MQALEVMKTYIVKTTPDTALAEALDLLDLYQDTCLPVVDAQGRLVGLLTEHDAVCAVLPEGADANALRDENIAREAKARTVGEIMTTPPIAILEHADLLEAANLMLTHRLKRVPVIREDGVVVGVLSRIDICQAILEGNL